MITATDYNQIRQDEIDLINHIKEINTKSKEEMKNNPNMFIGMLVEDIKHWLEYDVRTIAQFERYMDECTLYETVSQATSKSQAIKWILQSENLENEKDAGYICYNLGLNYDKEYLFKEIH
jgi:hypothetical protein